MCLRLLISVFRNWTAFHPGVDSSPIHAFPFKGQSTNSDEINFMRSWYIEMYNLKWFSFPFYWQLLIEITLWYKALFYKENNLKRNIFGYFYWDYSTMDLYQNPQSFDLFNKCLLAHHYSHVTYSIKTIVISYWLNLYILMEGMVCIKLIQQIYSKPSVGIFPNTTHTD